MTDAPPVEVEVTEAVALVLGQFLANPGQDRFGLDLMQATGLWSGTLYPLLAMLEGAGWLRTGTEQLDKISAARRRPRVCYRLTPLGLAEATKAVEAR